MSRGRASTAGVEPQQSLDARPGHGARGCGAAALAVVGPGALALLLAGWVALRTPLWRDEIATLSFAQLSLPDLDRALAHVDAVFRPYYSLGHLVQLALPGPIGLRLPSVVGVVVAVLATSLLARRWWGTTSAVVAGLALALNPQVVQLGATARPYALAIAATALAGLSLDVAIERAARGRAAVWPFLGYAAALATAGWLHLFALLALPAFAVMALRRGRDGSFVLSTVAALAVVAPHALAAASQRGQVSWIPAPTPRSAAGSLASLTTARGDGWFGAPELLGAALALTTAGVAVVLLRRRTGERADQLRRLGAAAALTAAPWGALLAVSVIATPYLRTPYLAPSTVGLALLLGALVGVARHAGSDRRAPAASRLVAGLAVAQLAFSAVMTTTVLAMPWRVDDYPALATAIEDEVRPGDTLVVVQLYQEVGVASGLARAIDDDGYVELLQERLAAGTQPEIDVRVAAATDPIRTTAAAGTGGSGSWWVVWTRNAVTDDDLAVLEPQIGCRPRTADVESYGILRLARLVCATSG